MKDMKLASNFSVLFDTPDPPLIVRSPGRVNIIGEHTDYNEGFVLPGAIDKAIYVAVSKRDDEQVHLHSGDYHENITVALRDLRPTHNWATYVLGVASQLMQHGHQISGFNLALEGDVPIGAGLSSSAAVECATIFALNELFALGISKMDMVHMAQQAEHTFAGVMSGIMDQFASMFGKKDYVIKLDCRSLDYAYVPLNLEGYKIVLLNTNVKHALASTGYNTRRQQCEQGVAWVKEKYPETASLRDVTRQMLDRCVAPKDPVVYRRCKYVLDENERLAGAVKDLHNGNLQALGRKMFETHEGLRTAYEVSSPELDFLVDAVKNNPDVPGARMMGGGFGGCTINLVKADAINQLIERVSKSYKAHTGLELTAYIALIENGTAIVT